MGSVIEMKKSVPVVGDVDVLVVGAGIAGSTAAVAAGRSGARTMVVDRFGCPGGNMGPGMMGGAPNMEIPPALFEGGRLPGIPGEFIERCEQHCKAPLLGHYIRDSQVISYVWTQMMQEAGVQFMYNTYSGGPIMEGNRVTGLFVENKNGTQAIRAKVVVDATGDADVAARAGAPIDEGKSLFSSGTYWAMANVDIDRYLREMYPTWTPPGPECFADPGKLPDDWNTFPFTPNPEDVRWAERIDESIEQPHRSLADMAKSQSIGPFFSHYRRAWDSGEYRFMQAIDGLGFVHADHGIFRGVAGIQYVPDPLRMGKYGIIGAMVGVQRHENPTSGDTKVMTAIEVKVRNFIFETAQFLTRRIPGFEKAYLHIIAPYFNSRGGRSAICDYQVTTEDVEQETEFDDVVFRGGNRMLGLHPTRYKAYFDFPYRQFLPRDVDGLLVTGRACIVQPPVMRIRWMVLLMGQAAGVASALAARADVTPRKLDVRRLQGVLHDEYRVPLGDRERLQGLGII
ncbi:FAD-dependent oxidoreductase [Candidatus Latescibacterota bacterium]